MPFNRVIAVVADDPSDINTVSRAADIVRDDRGHLYVIYVIKVQRSLPLDAEIEEQIARGEQVLHRSERLARLPRQDIDSQLLQARDIGPAVVHEAVVRDADAIVIGTSYPTDYGSFSLGSDIPYILEHAPCDVILWREHSSAARPVARTSRNGRG
ncbi:universal stress protein [Candidatus Lucifugimonas marina]|jgi:nucleotide-binding universal stress UspA family protein|uniref:Universal stress protein n=1 Tax=Candidatus Lucifugimonas marina TaxID=3038979 RepID=A0AAJ5ZG85_9CHLR|nr:universal stress protein [SAR202 cluster bacterium JH702]MDG0869665.1 universal stress protein [SAR202 cluster bacterium JH639]WFG34398.1 universal stress protein [SAR202 cluster bacterium JH545]WFG38327.1 universal stress protein [SAR202 cluster bacterium JH1073]